MDTRPDDAGGAAARPGAVTVRFWAAARSAAGTHEESLAVAGPVTLASVHRRVREQHPGRLSELLEVCSVLIEERPVTTADPERVEVAPGQTVEYLPPFAGG